MQYNLNALVFQSIFEWTHKVLFNKTNEFEMVDHLSAERFVNTGLISQAKIRDVKSNQIYDLKILGNITFEHYMYGGVIELLRSYYTMNDILTCHDDNETQC